MSTPDKRGNRTCEVLVRDLSGNPTYQELTPEMQAEPKGSFPTGVRTASLNRTLMTNRRTLAAGIAVVACWFLVPELGAQQDDAPSAYDKCRIVTSVDLADKKAPKFAAYPISSTETVENPRLDLKSNATARMYRTVLRQEISLGPNFAGHYRVAVWGCGSSCAMFAVVNLKTGRVITPDGFSHTSAVYFGVESWDVLPQSQRDDGLFGFRKDSRLLLVLGDLDEDEGREGAFYLVLDKEHLRLAHSTLVRKDCENLRGKR